MPAGAHALHHSLPDQTAADPRTSRTQTGKRLSSTPAEANGRALSSGLVSEAWLARYNWAENSYDKVTATATDSAGNVYVTGYAFRSTSYTYVTIKYDGGSGRQLWEAVYSGFNDRVPTSLAVDRDGNVVVTGSSYGSTLYDYLTVKYSARGQQLWEARYNGPDNQDDLASSVAVDAAGNVVVTGTSYQGSNRYDYATVRYSASGQLLWQAQYNGATSGDDLPTSVAVDATGHVYVTGTTYTSTQSDYATLKYDATTGQLQWAAFYNAPANSYDLVRDLAVDATGHVTVTGTSDNGRSYDYATVRYASSGQQEWVQHFEGAAGGYDEATALTLDAAGNVVVTGYAETTRGNWDYVTYKYAAGSGQPLWQAQYNGPDGGYEEARDVAIDGEGNVAVTGRSFTGRGQSEYATVLYSTAGQVRWTSRYHGPAPGDEAPTHLTLDGLGNVVVVGDAAGRSPNDFDYAVGKYAAATGQVLWQATYSGIRMGSYLLTDFAVDAAGNVYVTGTSNNSLFLGGAFQVQTAYLTVKYSPSGQLLWEARRRFRPNVFRVERSSLAVDAAGNVYICGSDFGSSFIVKYSPNGQQLWQVPTDPLMAVPVVDIAADAAGNVYVSGADFDTGKYAADGTLLWVASFNGPPSSVNIALSMTLDAAGDVLVGGSSASSSNSSFGYATVKYAGRNGGQLWKTSYTGMATSSDDRLTALTVDAANHVYVTGRSLTDTNGYDYVTIKYDGASGQPQWTARYNGVDSRRDEPSGVAVDAAGSVYVTGASYNADNTRDYATVKYTGSSGQQEWAARYNGPANRDDYATALATDATGNVYVTGASTGSGSNTDYATLKYAATGAQLWEARYNGPGNGMDQALHLKLDAAGNVHVSGNSTGHAPVFDFATIKYAQTSNAFLRPLDTATRVAVSEASSRQKLTVYPNPAAATATVSFRPALDGAAQVQVYNQLGQQVAILYDGTVRKGQHYALSLHGHNLPAGLYTCSLLVGGQRETVRVLVSR
ncbi:T9SS type A sorting domain-containing protein [Hymenobacter sp. YC55]|nr:T9SS type A sorting domain-containing protein [Hymenobacter sp. YC55]